MRRLRLLRELDRLGSIAAVADALCFTPSAISQQLAQLERETGVQLIERTGRSSRLTPAARTLLEPIEAILAHLDEAEAVLARISGESTTAIVRLATFQSVALRLLPQVISRLDAEAPGLRLQVVECEPENALPALAAGELDFVIFDDYIGNPRPPETSIHREELCADRLLLALPSSHPFAARSALQLAELAEERWVLPTERTFYTPAIQRICSEHGGFMPRVEHWANSLLVVLALVDAEHAVTVLPELVEPEGANVALRPIGEPNLTRTIHTAVRSSAASHPAMVALRQALRKEAAARTRARAPVREAMAEPVKI